MISRLFLRVTNFQVLFANFFGSKIDYLALLKSNFMYIFEENYLNLILKFKLIFKEFDPISNWPSSGYTFAVC